MFFFLCFCFVFFSFFFFCEWVLKSLSARLKKISSSFSSSFTHSPLYYSLFLFLFFLPIAHSYFVPCYISLTFPFSNCFLSVSLSFPLFLFNLTFLSLFQAPLRVLFSSFNSLFFLLTTSSLSLFIPLSHPVHYSFPFCSLFQVPLHIFFMCLFFF